MNGPRELVFIAGAEGSGTTVLRTLLAAPSTCVAIGTKAGRRDERPDARALHADFDDVTVQLWDRNATLPRQVRAKDQWLALPDRVRSADAFAECTHLIFKRSFPFGSPHGAGSPDLLDIVDAFPDLRIIVVYRDPCAATYSAYRRGFDTDLRRLAVMCADQLSRLAGQVRALDPATVRVVSYRALCDEPARTLESICAFCDIPFEPVREAAEREQLRSDTDQRYARELPPDDAAWLAGYFDGRRRRQWEDVLEPEAG
jgi:hypothetical protein